MLSRPPAAPDAAFSIPASAFSVFSSSVSTALVSVFSAPASACSASEPAPAFSSPVPAWILETSNVCSGNTAIWPEWSSWSTISSPSVWSIIRKGSPETITENGTVPSAFCRRASKRCPSSMAPARFSVIGSSRYQIFSAPETGVRPARRLPQTDLLCSGDIPPPSASAPTILQGRYTIPVEKSAAAASPNQERSSEDRLFPLASLSARIQLYFIKFISGHNAVQNLSCSGPGRNIFRNHGHRRIILEIGESVTKRICRGLIRCKSIRCMSISCMSIFRPLIRSKSIGRMSVGCISIRRLLIRCYPFKSLL